MENQKIEQVVVKKEVKIPKIWSTLKQGPVKV
jgi:hypothetical protein